ncbi:O-antigen ligase family protein [candidate division KSB1 bacterium]|nr:O-antigen ligase family protein [candidate division KSB1 bacterium]
MANPATTQNELVAEKPRFESNLFNLVPLIILLTYLMMGGHFFFIAEGDYQAEGNFNHQIILSLSFFLAFLVLVRKPKLSIEILKANWLLLIFLLYALISCAWSPAPFVSFKRWIQFLGLILVGMAAISNVSGIKSMISIFRLFTAASLTLSFFLPLIKPSEPFMKISGIWNGLYGHKNLLGAACLIGLAVWLPAMFSKSTKIEYRCSFAMVLLSFLLLFLSRSTTSLLVCLVILAAFFVITLRVPITVKMFLTPTPVLAIYLLIVNLTPYSPMEFVLDIVGKDATFTGRTDLWAAVMDSFRENKYFGLGYNGFWVGKFGESSFFTSSLNWSRMVQAHNGYLDILNELGMVGFAIFLAFLGQALFRGFRFLKRNRQQGLVFLLIIIIAILSNFMESSFCRLVTLIWLMFLVSFVVMTPVNQNEFSLESEPPEKKQLRKVQYV